MDMSILTKKVVLVGDSGVGKSTLVRRALTGEFEPNYKPTLGVEVTPIVRGHPPQRFNVWECAGDPRYAGLGDGYYVQAHIAIVMYDSDALSSRVDWVTRVERMCPDIPIVECVVDRSSPNELEHNLTPNDIFHLNLATGEGVDELFDYLLTL